MSIIGILAAMAGIAVIYVSWSILKFIFTFFVKIIVFIGMASFVILMFLIFIGATLSWLADAKHNKERQVQSQVNNSIITPVSSGYPFGIPIPQKKGYIQSPYTNKVIDVRGYPPDTLIKDPYTGNLLLVP